MLCFYSKNLFIIVLLCIRCSFIKANQEIDWSFPKDFLIGSATSAYQIEGAWNISDKGENCWDRFAHVETNKIADRSNGDVACDSYHKYKEDVQLLKQMGMDFYRFSLSWSRILPTGYSNVVSKDGIRYYNDLINELIKTNIMPVVTLYHWDHPQVFQDMGGWTNEAMVDWFGDYARVVYREFGDRVKIFQTINEPFIVCFQGYNIGDKAPGLKLGGVGDYLCNTNIIKAHARAYHIYDKEFRAQQKGQVGITLNANHFFSKKGDDESVEIAYQFSFDRYAHPIFSKDGDYPSIFKKKIEARSKLEGLERSRLPTFSKEWIDYIKGTADFIGLNHYTTLIAEHTVNNTNRQSDADLLLSYDPNWPTTKSRWLRVVPEGFLHLLLRVKNTYGNVPMYIMENGMAEDGKLHDPQRMEYLQLYMKSMLTAIKKYGCNVKAYTIWSLLDNYEWEQGYTERFGLVYVDFNSPNKTRILKESAHWITQVIKERKILPLPNNSSNISQN